MLNIGSDSQFIAFVDECGDHTLTNMDRDFPIFVLSIVIIERKDYIEKIIPDFGKFKLSYWNHEGINLHSRDIRRAIGPFSLLQNSERRTIFFEHLNSLMENLPYTLFLGCIKKQQHIDRYGTRAKNPYDLALTFCLERIVHFMDYNNEEGMPFIFEQRGKREDNDLEIVFDQVTTSGTYQQPASQFNSKSWSLVFRSKRDNILGLQISDLCAHPASRYVLDPSQPNRAFEIIEKHVYRRGSSWTGMKIFP